MTLAPDKQLIHTFLLFYFYTTFPELCEPCDRDNVSACSGKNATTFESMGTYCTVKSLWEKPSAPFLKCKYFLVKKICKKKKKSLIYTAGENIHVMYINLLHPLLDTETEEGK